MFSKLPRHSRRRFLRSLGLLPLASWLPLRGVESFFGPESPAEASTQSSTNPLYRNRAPLAPRALDPLPLGSIRAAGWLQDQLRIQANGLSGHLGEVWADVGPDSGWLGGSGESWERGPYYLDGIVPLAYLLDDSILKAKALRFINWTLDHQAESGMIGPASNDDWWPRIVMLKVLTQYHELTADTRVIPVMDKFFRYQLSKLPAKPLRDWSRFRWQDELLSVIWLYNRTGSAYLLQLAQLLHAQGYSWPTEFADFRYTERLDAESLSLNHGGGLKDLALATHGVNNGQGVKTGPVWSQISGLGDDRAAAAKMISELNRYHGLPNGMFSCDEHLAGRDPSQGSELCTVVEYMFSLEQSLSITGDPSFGDLLEKLTFNALPGAMTDDMWAHQYNQEPNQVECSLHHKPWTTDGPESNLFGLAPNFGCCTANYHQGWPKFAASLFMMSPAEQNTRMEGLVATAYAPCEVHTTISGTFVHVVEETGYPFRGTVRLTVNPAVPRAFPLQLRIPAWAAGTKIRVNGQSEPRPEPESFARIERTWNSGDRVEIDFPLTPRVSHWFRDSIAFERGPLVFSYGIGENWVKLVDREKAADWQVFPTDQWNYAVHTDEQSSPGSISVTESQIGEYPFSRHHPAVQLEVKAQKVEQWRAEDGATNPLPQSPVNSDQPEETIVLIPYASAKLRITAFPQIRVR